AKQYKSGIQNVFGGYIFADEKDVNKNIFQFGQNGLGLPTKDYYFKTDEESKKIQDAYINYITTLLKASGVDDAKAAADAQAIYNFEKTLAGSSYSPVEMRDPNKMYNKFSPSQITEKTGIDWSGFLNNVGATQGIDSILVSNPKY